METHEPEGYVAILMICASALIRRLYSTVYQVWWYNLSITCFMKTTQKHGSHVYNNNFLIVVYIYFKSPFSYGDMAFLRTSLEISVLGCHVMCYPWYYLYMILFLLLFVYIHNDGRDRNNYE